MRLSKKDLEMGGRKRERATPARTLFDICPTISGL
jgi:hypothetical protein